MLIPTTYNAIVVTEEQNMMSALSGGTNSAIDAATAVRAITPYLFLFWKN